MTMAGATTSTAAESALVTAGPTGGCPVTVATFVKSRVTPLRAQA
jgi:hypothetical protein